MPNELREIIARNIRNCRLKKFPGHGGGKKCAGAFGVSPQQWSPWEKGNRTPDEVRLAQLADFFGVTVEWMRREHHPPSGGDIGPPPPDVGRASQNMGDTGFPFGGISGVDVPPSPVWEPAPPGSAASFFWLARHFIMAMQQHGLRVHFDKQSLEYLAHLLKSI